MPLVKTQGGKVITKDGKVSCECCGPEGPPCPLGSDCVSSGNVVKKPISNAQALLYYAGGTWNVSFAYSISAVLQRFFKEFATDPCLLSSTTTTSFAQTATSSFIHGVSSCGSSTNVGPISIGNNTTIVFTNPPSVATQFSGNFFASLSINLRKISSGGYCLDLSALARAGYIGGSPMTHFKNDITTLTLEGTSATIGGTGCGTVLPPDSCPPNIASASGTITISATFTPFAP
jgi:hypothetical protein